nr:hypothetical protein [Armatimonadota bacterium]
MRFVVVCLLSCFVSICFAYRPPRNYDLVDVLWKVSLDDTTSTVHGDVTNTIRPLRFPLLAITFDCGAALQVKKVQANGKDMKFIHYGDSLTFKLPKVEKGRVAVRIVYSGQPQAGMYFIPASRAFPSHYPVIYTQGEMEDTRHWLPTYDYPDDKSGSECYIDVPTSYYAVSNGALVGTSQKNGRKVFH